MNKLEKVIPYYPGTNRSHKRLLHELGRSIPHLDDFGKQLKEVLNSANTQRGLEEHLTASVETASQHGDVEARIKEIRISIDLLYKTNGVHALRAICIPRVAPRGGNHGLYDIDGFWPTLTIVGPAKDQQLLAMIESSPIQADRQVAVFGSSPTIVRDNSNGDLSVKNILLHDAKGSAADVMPRGSRSVIVVPISDPTAYNYAYWTREFGPRNIDLAREDMSGFVLVQSSVMSPRNHSKQPSKERSSLVG